MDQRVSLITLGTDDLARGRAFYEALGWQVVSKDEGVIAFDLIGQAIGLYPRDALAKDVGLPVTKGFSGITLSHNVPTKEDVATITEQDRAAGATILKEPHDVFWGGHISYFSDPDGHVWEVAHNPYSSLGPNGEFKWNGH
jgi:catechol 2,3-dioxygenase-like lactoylglutathione lyase family enzyme